MKYINILLVMISFITLNAQESLVSSETCKGCHPTIYSEFYNSAHRKSSIFEDPIHNAIWNKHPNKAKNKYTCNECHTPSDVRITNALKYAKDASPVKNNVQTKEAISCVFCHSINIIEKHAKPYNKIILNNNVNVKRPILYAANKNNRKGKILYKEEKSFFGIFKKTSGSPFHDIDYTNKDFYTGNMCMGCHAHFENSHKQNICTVEQAGASNEKQNCITCHMPQVKGSATTIKITKQHTFHGFAGTRNKPEMLAKYIDFKLNKTNDNFELTITNKATHNLLLHPLRLGKLNVRVNTTKLKSTSFMRILGKNKKPAMPWLATNVLKNTMLKANESRTIKYNTKLKSGDTVEVELGYFLVNPKMHKKLNLQNNEEVTKFNTIKIQYFNIK